MDRNKEYTCIYTNLETKVFNAMNVRLAIEIAKKYGLNHDPIIFPVTVQLTK